MPDPVSSSGSNYSSYSDAVCREPDASDTKCNQTTVDRLDQAARDIAVQSCTDLPILPDKWCPDIGNAAVDALEAVGEKVGEALTSVPPELTWSSESS